MITKNNPSNFEINWESKASETCQTIWKWGEGGADAAEDCVTKYNYNVNLWILTPIKRYSSSALDSDDNHNDEGDIDDDNDEADDDVEYCKEFAPHMITKKQPCPTWNLTETCQTIWTGEKARGVMQIADGAKMM